MPMYVLSAVTTQLASTKARCASDSGSGYAPGCPFQAARLDPEYLFKPPSNRTNFDPGADLAMCRQGR